MKSNAKLRVVPDEQPDIYTEHRQHILSRDWSRVHVSADKRAPFASVMGKWR